MSEKEKQEIPVPSIQSTTITIVGSSNFAPLADSRALRSYEVTSYTAPGEQTKPSAPLQESAVRIGNSLLNARVPESAFLRDDSEEF